MARSPRKSSLERQNEVVDTVLALVGTVGPERVTTEAIAKAIGVTQAAVFRHFSNKAAIWCAVIGKLEQLMTERWQAAAAGPGSAKARLRRLVLSQAELIEQLPAVPSILFSRELHYVNDDLRERLYSLVQHFGNSISDAVRDGQQRGEFTSSLSPKHAAQLLVGLLHGAVVRWSLSGRAFALADELEQVLNAALELLTQPTPQEPCR